MRAAGRSVPRSGPPLLVAVVVGLAHVDALDDLPHFSAIRR